MTERVLQTQTDVKLLSTFLSGQLPCTVKIEKGKKRSIEQNRLQRMWMNEAAQQLQDETPEEKRAYCKLHFGVPILRAASDEFREQYDRIIRPLTYEQKLDLMMVPIDFPTTRLMTVKQKREYLDRVYVHFTGLGVKLTEPNFE